MIVLHPHQLTLKYDIYNSWNAGNRNVLGVLPTGGGKSIVISDITLDGVKQNMRQAVIAHRNELVTQMSCHIARQGISHRIIGSDTTVRQAVDKHYREFGKSFVHPSAPTAVVGVDTLMSRQEDLKQWAQQIDRWTIDEAHHTIGNERVEPNKWGRAVKMFSNAYGLGVTATPIRADGQGLGRTSDGVFDAMVQGPSMRWLIENNFLADYEIVCPKSDLYVDDTPVGKDGDWSSQTLRKAAKKSHIVGDVVQNYVRYAPGRKAIVFATDVETAGEIAKKFTNAAINAASLSAKSLPAVREKYLKDFADGKLRVLINVDLFDEGFDCPSCDVVILARPTASLGKYRQMVGRALRYMPNKLALIIDHVSNVIRHKLPDNHVAWSLNRRDKRAKQAKDPNDIELTVCAACAKPYERFRQSCPYCGFSRPLPEPRSRSIEMVEGDLILLDKAMLEKMRGKTVLEAPGDIANRVAAVAGAVAGKGAANRQMVKFEAHRELCDSVAQWAAVERARGFNDSEIQRKFYLTMGVDVLTALDASKPSSEMNTLTETVKGWYA